MSQKTLPATQLNSNLATAKEELGRLRFEGGKVYRYVKNVDIALADGDSVEFAATDGYQVTKDRSGGSSIGRVVAGVARGTLSVGYYGWIQVSGRHASIKTDGGVSAGDVLIPHATVDGRADTGTSASTVVITSGQRFAFALETDDGTTSIGTCAGQIVCL